LGWLFIKRHLGPMNDGFLGSGLAVQVSDSHEWASRARGESRVVEQCGPLASGGEWRRVASRTVAQRKMSGGSRRV
jgi:hypothetical protein